MPRVKSSTAKKHMSPGALTNGVLEHEVMTLDEAASYLRVSPGEVLQMIASEALPGRKFGQEWRFHKTAIMDWLGQPPTNQGLLSHAGKIKDDPYTEEMLREIYKQRGRPEVEE